MFELTYFSRGKAALQFQPVRRPQASQTKTTRPTKKPGASSSLHAFSSSTNNASLAPSASSPDKQPAAGLGSTPAVQRSNIEDWMGDEDDEYYLENKPKHERGGRKKKKKAQVMGGENAVAWSWDDIYDPSMPNSYADYKGSDEQAMEIRDWKARLYYHQLKKTRKSASAGRSEEPERKTQMNGMLPGHVQVYLTNHDPVAMFAPPAALSFAPPSFDEAPSRPPPADDDGDHYPPSVPRPAVDTSVSYESPPSFARATVSENATGDDAYASRMRLSAAAPTDPRLAPPAVAVPLPPVQSTVDADKAAADIAAKKAEAAAKIAAFKAKVEAHKAAKAGHGTAASPTPPAAIAAAPVLPGSGSDAPTPPPPEPQQPEQPSGTISRAPVRYNLPPAAPDMPINEGDVDMSDRDPDTDAPRSLRPGQKGFAERLLKKYGWEKGQGLGAEGNEGITTAIVAKAEKRKKKSDAEGGGWVAPANMGKIVGGKRRKVNDGGDGEEAAQEGEALPYGPLSHVIKLEGMLKGLDVDDEVQNRDLYGEIGREMETEYGKVERVYLWRANAEGNEAGEDVVFVKFTSQLSALRAVGACDGKSSRGVVSRSVGFTADFSAGMEFADNIVKARFWDSEAFEKGVYA